MGVHSLLIDMHVLMPRSPPREESRDKGKHTISQKFGIVSTTMTTSTAFNRGRTSFCYLPVPRELRDFFGSKENCEKCPLLEHAMTLAWSLANCRVPQIRETEWLGCGCYLTGMARGCTLLIEPVEYSEPWLAVERPGRRNLYFALGGEYHSLPTEPRNFGVWFIGVR